MERLYSIARTARHGGVTVPVVLRRLHEAKMGVRVVANKYFIAEKELVGLMSEPRYSLDQESFNLYHDLLNLIAVGEVLDEEGVSLNSDLFIQYRVILSTFLSGFFMGDWMRKTSPLGKVYEKLTSLRSCDAGSLKALIKQLKVLAKEFEPKKASSAVSLNFDLNLVLNCIFSPYYRDGYPMYPMRSKYVRVCVDFDRYSAEAVKEVYKVLYRAEVLLIKESPLMMCKIYLVEEGKDTEPMGFVGIHHLTCKEKDVAGFIQQFKEVINTYIREL